MGAPDAARPRRVLIAGAAGRDFHDFNLVFRDDPAAQVVAFTAAQIPGIAGRSYPAALAGPLYPDGIPIRPEAELESLIAAHRVDEVVFSYSDVPHAHVMRIASRAQGAGAGFRLLSPERTMLAARVPVIAVCAVRTGCGKSAIARWIVRRLAGRGLRVAVIRHPMPYGDLLAQRAQRFETMADLDAAGCTVEEREEYEPHLALGQPVHAGVDCAEVLSLAQAGADAIVWDGGNNDFPFVRPDLLLVAADAWRPADASGWHPGEAVLRRADVVVVNKTDTAPAASTQAALQAARAVNPSAPVLEGRMPVRLDDEAAVRGRRTVVVEDGPTVTHGGAAFGAGWLAARAAGGEIVDPRGWLAGESRRIVDGYPHLGPVLPALGYSAGELRELAAALAAVPADVVVAGTPVDLGRLLAPLAAAAGLKLPPVIRARYDFEEANPGELAAHVDRFAALASRRPHPEPANGV